MAITRRDFLRNSACAIGGMALASSIDTFSVVHALTPQAATDYRALVCVFLNGGNDGNNMLVSLDQYDGPAGSLVEGYSNVRSAAGLAIAQGEFASGVTCERWLIRFSSEHAGDADPLQPGKTRSAL